MFVQQEYEYSTALIDDKGRCITYLKLEKLVSKLAANFRMGDLVLLKTRNSIESIICYIACMRSRCIPLLVNEHMDKELIRKLINEYKINYYIDVKEKGNLDCEEEFVGTIIKAISLVNKEKVEVNPELALLLSTSGSTGSNKVVRISRRNLESNTRNICTYLNISSEDVAITSLPMNYTYGLSVINTHLYAGAKVVVTKHMPYTGEFWEIFRKYKVTSFSGVPYTYEMLRKMNFSLMNMDSLDTLTVAGGRLNVPEEKYYSEYSTVNNKKLIIMYGQTEATARISYRPADMLLKKSQSIGVPIPEGKMWIEDESGKIVDSPFVQGEIVYQGENVAMGYAYGADELVKGYEWGDILHTGDLGYRDEDGYFYIVGRKDRMVKINGNRIDLEDLENLLKEKFKGHLFRCEMEKCMDNVISKRICIHIDETLFDNENCYKYKKCTDEEIINYISLKMHMNRIFFEVKRIISA